MRRLALVLVPIVLGVSAVCEESKGGTSVAAPVISISSPSFDHQGPIPPRFTCDGEDVSPALEWSGVPAGTKSLALIVDDPDAPGGTFVHWVYYDLPASLDVLAEGFTHDESPEEGGIQGRNSFRSIGYRGPCPPDGVHRYFFTLYALDTLLELGPGATKADVLAAAENHIIGRGVLMGTYAR